LDQREQFIPSGQSQIQLSKVTGVTPPCQKRGGQLANHARLPLGHDWSGQAATLEDDTRAQLHFKPRGRGRYERLARQLESCRHIYRRRADTRIAVKTDRIHPGVFYLMRASR